MSTGTPLPLQTPDETVQMMAVIVQRLGNLSAYLLNVDPPTIYLKSFSSRPACATLPPTTGLNIAVEDDRLELALAAVEVLGRALVESSEVHYKLVPTECLIPGTNEVDHEMTRKVATLPERDDEPLLPAALNQATLPRLGPEQIKLRIAEIRQFMGDLSVYLDEAPDGSPDVCILTFAGKVSYSMPGETGLGEPVSKAERIWTANALRRLNAALRDKRRLEYTPVPAPADLAAVVKARRI